MNGRSSRRAGRARIEGLLEGNIGRGDVLAGKISRQSVRNDNRVIPLIEVCQITAVLLEAWENLPAKPVAERQTTVDLEFILSEETILCGGSTDIWAGDSEVKCGWRAFEEVAKGVASKLIARCGSIRWLKYESSEVV